MCGGNRVGQRALYKGKRCKKDISFRYEEVFLFEFMINHPEGPTLLIKRLLLEEFDRFVSNDMEV